MQAGVDITKAEADTTKVAADTIKTRDRKAFSRGAMATMVEMATTAEMVTMAVMAITAATGIMGGMATMTLTLLIPTPARKAVGQAPHPKSSAPSPPTLGVALLPATLLPLLRAVPLLPPSQASGPAST